MSNVKTRCLILLASLFVPLALAQDADVKSEYRLLAEQWALVNYEVSRSIREATLAESSAGQLAGINSLETLLLRGSDHAALQLAYAHLKGVFGVDVDLEKSQRLYEFGVRQENTTALLQYGLMLRHGHTFAVDAARGDRLILRAAQLGDNTARAYLIDELTALGDDYSLAQAREWQRLSGMTADTAGTGRFEVAEAGVGRIAIGRVQLAEYFRRGEFVPTSPERAEQLLDSLTSDVRTTAHMAVSSAYARSDLLWVDQQRAADLGDRFVDRADPEQINNYAWLLSISMDGAVRDGPRAVQLMEDMLADNERQMAWVDTLAAAYAETGEFDAAIETQREAISLIKNSPWVLDEAEERLALYQEGRTWRD